MATSRQLKTIDNEPDREQITEALAALRHELLDEDTFTGEALTPGLESLYAELGVTDGAEATVFVTLEDADGKGNAAGIWKGEPEDFNLEGLAKKFGSGAYRVKVYVKIPGGPKSMRANKLYHWKLSPEDEAKRLNPTAPAQQVTQGDIAKAVAEAMRGILPMLQSPAQPAMNMREMIDLFRVMQPPVQQIDPMAMLKLGVEMSAARNQNEPTTREPGSNTNDVIVTLIEKFGSPIAQMVTQAQNRQGNNTPLIAPVAQAPQTEYINETTQQEPQDMNIIAEMKLKAGISFLISQAAAGNPVSTSAELIIDNVPADTLHQVLASPDPVAWLASFNSDVTAHQDWFKEMLDEVKNILNEPPEPVNS